MSVPPRTTSRSTTTATASAARDTRSARRATYGSIERTRRIRCLTRSPASRRRPDRRPRPYHHHPRRRGDVSGIDACAALRRRLPVSAPGVAEACFGWAPAAPPAVVAPFSLARAPAPHCVLRLDRDVSVAVLT